jgi:hypothetical protein
VLSVECWNITQLSSGLGQNICEKKITKQISKKHFSKKSNVQIVVNFFYIHSYMCNVVSGTVAAKDPAV